MTVRTVFILCIATSLSVDYAVDLGWVLFLACFSPGWRRAGNDVMLLLLSLLFLFLFRDYVQWRGHYPISAGIRWQAAAGWLRDALGNRIDLVATGGYRAFLTAVLLGDKALLEDEITNTFRVYGMSHMLAVSGFHIGFWVLLLTPIITLGRSSFTARFLHLFVSVFLLVYAVTVGGSHSVFRAVWSYVLSRWASVSKLNIPALYWPMLVAVGHCLIDPTAPRSLSFQLSYTAVFAILMALKGTNLDQFTVDFSPPQRGVSRIQKALLPVHISLAAWSATLPIVQYHFSGASPYFLVGNLLIVPLYTLSIWVSVPLMLFAEILPEEWCVLVSEGFVWMQAKVVLHAQYLELHQ